MLRSKKSQLGLRASELAEFDRDLLSYEASQWSLIEFTRNAWHILEPSTQFIENWSIGAIVEHLDAITIGQIRRLLINVPPGLMKSLLSNVFWPAWEWGCKGLAHYRIIGASHNIDLAIRDSRKMKILIESDWYQIRFPHLRLARDQSAKGNFENTLMGFRRACAFASMTGHRGDRINVDDPLSVDDAKSPTILKSSAETFRKSVSSRLVDPKKSSIMVIMQRLKEGDTSSVALELGYEHLMLPMRYESARKCNTSIGFVDPRTSEGELLFPDRFSEEAVKELENSLGLYEAAGQLQQRPAPEGGGIIRDEWWCYFTPTYDAQYRIISPIVNYIVQSWDTAFKTNEQNDFSVCLTLAVNNTGVYIIHRLKEKLTYPDLLDKVKSHAAKYNPNIILIEDKASGQSLIQSIKKETRLPIKAFKVDKDKVTRAHAVSAFIEAGRVFLLKDAAWVKDYVYNMGVFPAGAHDDDVDATTQALAHIFLHTQAQVMPNLNIMGR